MKQDKYQKPQMGSLLPFRDRKVSLEEMSKEELATIVRSLTSEQNEINYTRPEKPTILRVTLDIREDLIDQWGTIIINKFSLQPDGELAISGEDVFMPGFVGQGWYKDDILFYLQTKRVERIKGYDKSKKKEWLTATRSSKP